MNGPPKGAAETTPAVEWAVGAFGAAVVAGMVGFLVWDGLAAVDGPPDIRVTALPARPTAGGHLVPFIAENIGGATASAVRIEGALRDGGAILETSVVALDYLPQGGAARGGLFFSADPSAFALTLRAQGYAEP